MNQAIFNAGGVKIAKSAFSKFLGVGFDREERNIGEFLVEEM